MTQDTVAVAADHAGFPLKETLKGDLIARGLKVLDLGTDGPASVDYPDFADRLAHALARGEASRGVVVCGSGIGISIAANRHSHVRAALCGDATAARLARQHNDANVLALGARTTGEEVARECLKVFIDTKFDGGRHASRVAKLSKSTCQK